MQWGRTISKRRLAAKIVAEVDALPKGGKSALSKAIGVSSMRSLRSLRTLDAKSCEFALIAAHFGYAPMHDVTDMFVAVEKKEAA